MSSAKKVIIAVDNDVVIRELMESELQVVQFIGMAREPFTPIFNRLGVYAPPKLSINRIHDWELAAPWEQT